MGCHSLLQGIFPIQGLNMGLLHCRQILYHLSHQGSQVIYCCVISSVQSSRSVVSNSLRPHGLHAAHQASLSIINCRSLLRLVSIKSVMPSNHPILCHPLLPSLIFLSIRVFSSESALSIRWPECWSFSFSISLSNEYSGLISFRIDWFDLLAVQGTLKSLL